MSNEMTNYLHFDSDILVGGVDESNRGGLIYDVIASCVVLPQIFADDQYLEIKDSKKLTFKKRRRLAEYIKENAITYGIGKATNYEIDSTNILSSTMKAMNRAIDEAYKKHSFHELKIDGPYFNGYVPPGFDKEILPHECVIKGDSKYLNIAAASILAKDYHDVKMLELINDYPILERYDLANNQGYGTKKHIDTINKYGITNFHRKSFGPCKNKSCINL
jgi:ribonuclease HII